MSTITVRYIVDDVDAAMECYVGQLEFDVRMRPAPEFAALERDGCTLLLNAPGAGGAGRALSNGTRPEPGEWNRIQLAVDDLSATVERLSDRGASFRNEILTGRGGKQILLEDPAGNLVELFEPTTDAAD